MPLGSRSTWVQPGYKNTESLLQSSSKGVCFTYSRCHDIHGTFNQHSATQVSMRNITAFAISLGGALGVIGAIEALTKLNWLKKRNMRKLMHTCTGLIYMTTWGNYNNHRLARWLCASVPALMSLNFAAVGAGLIKDPRLVASATRHGRAKELLGGPLMYGIIHSLLTGIWWRDSPAAIVGLAALCAGDGMAEVVGTSAGSAAAVRVPYNKDKSVIGSVACAVSAFLASWPLVSYYNKAGSFTTHLAEGAIIRGCTACSLLAAVVESLPFKEVDNITVPVAAGLLAAYGNVFK